MKRIEFIAPVEAMRGNFGSKQDLKYPSNDNKAFEAPANKTSYARNYEPRFIGAKVARTGLKYFAVKTKTAVKATAAWLKRAALMGAASAIYAWVLLQSSILAQLQAQFALLVADGYEGTFHKYVHNAIMEALAVGAASIVVVGKSANVTLGNNPFSDAATAIAISNKILVKFWKQLTANGITFTVDGATGIAFAEADFSSVDGEGRLNVLGLSTATVGQNDYVKLGALWLLDVNGNYVNENVLIEENAAYTLTSVAPEA